MDRRASVEHPIHDLLRRRWSPRAFAAQRVEAADLRALLEAARWAPSCYNEQPWSFLVARQEDEATFAKALDCLVPANQIWARRAPVLVISVARAAFFRGGKPNRHARHDVGLAVAQLSLEATARGLVVHQMAGFDPARARETFHVPEGFEPVSAIAIGYPGDADTLPDDLARRERAPRERKRQADFVFAARWGEPLVLGPEADYEGVLDFWLGTLDERGLAAPEKAARWWQKDEGFDQEIRSRFGATHAAILSGEREPWLASARGRLAYVIVLDQLSRNIFRGAPGMFAADELALRVAEEGISLGLERALAGDARAFLYLPFLHAEDLRVQERCVSLFSAFHDEVEGPLRERIAVNLRFARRHRDIIRDWGRFPHRNAILGRRSSAEELAFLDQPGSSF